MPPGRNSATGIAGRRTTSCSGTTAAPCTWPWATTTSRSGGTWNARPSWAARAAMSANSKPEAKPRPTRMNRILKTLATAGLFSVAAFGSGAFAQSWPERPITWIVGGAAGGPTDAVARTIAQQVSTKLGQPIVIENIGGAGGTIASAKVARAKADGYTFLVGHVGYVAAAPSLYTKLDYNPVKDFDAVFRIPDIPGVIVVNPRSPYKTLAEMLAWA